MSRAAPARAGARRALGLVGLALAIAAVVGTLGNWPASSEATAFGDALRGTDHSALGEEDGLVPGGASVFDETPAVANLDPKLLAALRRGARDAASQGVDFRVNSGWRSAEYQEHLFREAVSEHGSEKEAGRWVATVQTSAHVTGDAVDIGPMDAAGWLSEHGARYGLCQIYRNEAWHYELRPEATTRGCPAMYDDPAHDLVR